MKRPFELLDQIADIVIAESFWQPKRLGTHHEPFPAAGLLSAVQSGSEELIDHFLEGLARLSDVFSKLGADIVIQSESGSHIKTLTIRHHDVKTGPPLDARQ